MMATGEAADEALYDTAEAERGQVHHDLRGLGHDRARGQRAARRRQAQPRRFSTSSARRPPRSSRSARAPSTAAGFVQSERQGQELPDRRRRVGNRCLAVLREEGHRDAGHQPADLPGQPRVDRRDGHRRRCSSASSRDGSRSFEQARRVRPSQAHLRPDDPRQLPASRSLRERRVRLPVRFRRRGQGLLPVRRRLQGSADLHELPDRPLEQPVQLVRRVRLARASAAATSTGSTRTLRSSSRFRQVGIGTVTQTGGYNPADVGAARRRRRRRRPRRPRRRHEGRRPYRRRPSDRRHEGLRPQACKKGGDK